MLRVCGATEERDSFSSAGCWCGGLFCGKGGYKASREFRRDARVTMPAYSFAQFLEMLRQQDLYDGGALREKWETRAVNHRERRVRGRKRMVTA